MRKWVGEERTVRSKGPKTEPWGTPEAKCDVAETAVPILTNCRPSTRYDFNKERAESRIPKLWPRRFVRIE